MVSPDCRKRVCPMSAGLVADGQQHELAVLYALDVAVNDLQLGWINRVIGRVDGGKRSADFFQLWFRVVVSGGVKVVEHVVSVSGFHASGNLFCQEGVGSLPRGSGFLHLQRAAAHDEQNVERSSESMRLGFVFSIV